MFALGKKFGPRKIVGWQKNWVGEKFDPTKLTNLT